MCELRPLVATALAFIGIQVVCERSLAKDEFYKYNLEGARRVSERSLTRDRNRVGTARRITVDLEVNAEAQLI